MNNELLLLSEVLLDVCSEKSLTIATVESCTGGLVSARLTSVPGSSRVVLGGVVAYADEVKRGLLGVDETLLAAHGAVSEPVARALASGARARLGATWGIGVTGIAGPGGGSATKPVGTVHLAVDGPVAGEAVHYVSRFPGDRERVRRLSSQTAREMLRRRLVGLAPLGSPGRARDDD